MWVNSLSLSIFFCFHHLASARQHDSRSSGNFVPIVGTWLRNTRQSALRFQKLQHQNNNGFNSNGNSQPSYVSVNVNNNVNDVSVGGGGGLDSGLLPAPVPTTQAPYNNEEADTTEDGEIDLHNKEFCVDVSSYQPVVWEERPGESCETRWTMMCQDRAEEVCQNVTETRCDVVATTDCKLGTETEEFEETKLTPKQFVEKVCTQGRKEIPHTKMLPECRNVTKQNCVTLWETDDDGKKQWAGTDSCEPVTWQECQLVPKQVTFIVPDISCDDGQEIWYHEPDTVTNTRQINTFSCQPRATLSCTSQTRPVCKMATWQDCREVPVPQCNSKPVHVPTQEYLHRKKCLLPDENNINTPGPSSGGSGGGSFGQERDTLPTYGG